MSTESSSKIVVRVEKFGDDKGEILGIYATETERNGNFPAVSKMFGHFTVDAGWYKNSTRPATPEEEQDFTEWFEPRYSPCILVKRRSARA